LGADGLNNPDQGREKGEECRVNIPHFSGINAQGVFDEEKKKNAGQEMNGEIDQMIAEKI